MNIPKPKRRVLALDGLRAFAIISILIYHLRLPWLPSGHLGVVVFLVLSGYLCTTSMVRMFERKGAGGLLGLWWHRFLRVWPSVATLVAGTGVLCATLNHVLLTKMRPDALPALGFATNWASILRGSSYFEQIGGTSPLMHLWYIATDMQFFIVWTLLLAITLKIGKVASRRIALVLSIASAAWMAYLFVPGSDPSRIYYGTDTRAFSLLLGAWLAFVFPLGKVPTIGKRLLVKPREVKTRHGRVKPFRATFFSHLAGLLSFAGIVALMVLTPQDADWYYRGGFFGISVLAVILIATLLAPGSLMGRILSFPLFTYLGKRSFALYLWHYPIFLLMAANKTTTEMKMRLAAVVVALLAAELSYQLIEKPFAALASGEKKEKMDTTNEKADKSDGSKTPRKPGRARLVVTALIVLGLGGYAGYALYTTPDESLVPESAIKSTGAAADSGMDLSNRSISGADSESNEESEESNSGKSSKSEIVEITDYSIVHAPASEVNAGIYDPVLIGDSVPGDAGWERLPDGLFDCYIGRQPSQAVSVFKDYIEQGVVGKVAVFACFSNSTPRPEQLDEIMELAGSNREVYFVATVNPDGFQDAANSNLMDVTDRYENAHYIDWVAVHDARETDYLWSDDTHLRPEGAVAYVNMVTHAVAQDLVDAGGNVEEPTE
ncbi:MAG: acyltransferase family protein [Coriobacteriales bacterium]|nr:acyltransferase family protein [Coriobacteriales bacterium]